MRKYKQKELKALVRMGAAVDITNLHHRKKKINIGILHKGGRIL